MSDIAIRAEHLGKQFYIGSRQESYRTLRESLMDALASPARRVAQLARGRSALSNMNRTFWALKDVSFEVQQGEVIGVIGRNGAGKSTLLKILSRITDPTEGQVRLYGRVASLLEVGTGFHPELTGRENIFLNGAILGMRRAEITRKFDEIVDFAEVAAFVDTPVKHYSSGMHMRLAFAVAAHLEPEILIVDEVLAVGDIAFQKKCLGKMDDVAKGGRTVLFVSHQMNQIRRLCERCIWLEEGRVRQIGETSAVAGSYEAAVTNPTELQRAGRGSQQAGAQFLRWQLRGQPESEPHLLDHFGAVTLQVTLHLPASIKNGHHGIHLYNHDHQIMWSAALDRVALEAGTRTCSYHFPALPLRPGLYNWYFSLYEEGHLLDEWYALPPMIIGTTPNTHPLEHLQGILNMPWQLETS